MLCRKEERNANRFGSNNKSWKMTRNNWIIKQFVRFLMLQLNLHASKKLSQKYHFCTQGKIPQIQLFTFDFYVSTIVLYINIIFKMHKTQIVIHPNCDAYFNHFDSSTNTLLISVANGQKIDNIYLNFYLFFLYVYARIVN